MLPKNEERDIMSQVAGILRPHLAHAETYGLQACFDLCIAWARAIDADMPLESYQRDREEARHAKAESERSAKAILDEARARAKSISTECDLECRRMRNALMKSITTARTNLETIQRGFESQH